MADLTQATQTLRQYWGFESFRPGQQEAVETILDGQDTVILFPTGGGKSVCYQLTALQWEGLTLVISPLVALMQDQVQQLKDRGIRATFINSTLYRGEVEQRLVNARNGMYDLLYLAPERLDTQLWQQEAGQLNISMVAVDEAHCISEWGHDFRPVYREIKPLLEPFAKDAVWVALTATATPEVRRDIVESLELDDPAVISRGFERPNLKWWVLETARKDERLLEILRKAKGAGLVYGGTRANCERLAEKINKTGIRAAAYHAGLDNEDRERIQQAWIDDEIPVVVATSAFGMGIDKPDCRYVVHYDIPGSLEAYYQEAGRAGRDGEESYPILLYKPSDEQWGRRRIEESYPTLEQLQHVYDAVGDALELAVGSELEELEPVDLEELQKRSGESRRMVGACLRILDQLGVIQLMQQFEAQIGVRFLRNASDLQKLAAEMQNRRKREFVDILHRQFGPKAIHQKEYLEERYLVDKLDVSRNGLLKGLAVLQNEQVLVFERRGEQPLVHLMEARQRRVPVDRSRLENYRDILLKKFGHMLGYVQTDVCRSRYIRKYFGEKRVPQHCGFCDNCLRRKNRNTELTEDDLNRVMQVLRRGKADFGTLRRETGWRKARLQDALQWLVREERVSRVEEEQEPGYRINSPDAADD